VHFQKAGIENTRETLRIAKEEALQRGIRFVLVASTDGDTGLQAARIFHQTGIKLIVITHNTGFKEPGVQELGQKARDEIIQLGGIVHTGTHVLRGIGAALRDRYKFSHEQVVADTLRMFGHGVKVCVEMAAMAADAGLIPPEDVIAIAGTQRGADTAAIIKADSSNRFFDIKVREILAKPFDFN
jgi:hypothetical protein